MPVLLAQQHKGSMLKSTVMILMLLIFGKQVNSAMLTSLTPILWSYSLAAKRGMGGLSRKRAALPPTLCSRGPSKYAASAPPNMPPKWPLRIVNTGRELCIWQDDIIAVVGELTRA